MNFIALNFDNFFSDHAPIQTEVSDYNYEQWAG